VDEDKLNNCPYVKINFGSEEVNVLLDSGSQISLVAEEIYEKLMLKQYPMLTLPIKAAILVTALGKKSKRLNKQTMVEF
jgi:hypothetical protein